MENYPPYISRLLNTGSSHRGAEEAQAVVVGMMSTISDIEELLIVTPRNRKTRSVHNSVLLLWTCVFVVIDVILIRINWG